MPRMCHDTSEMLIHCCDRKQGRTICHNQRSFCVNIRILGVHMPILRMPPNRHGLALQSSRLTSIFAQFAILSRFIRIHCKVCCGGCLTCLFDFYLFKQWLQQLLEVYKIYAAIMTRSPNCWLDLSGSRRLGGLPPRSPHAITLVRVRLKAPIMHGFNFESGLSRSVNPARAAAAAAAGPGCAVTEPPSPYYSD